MKNLLLKQRFEIIFSLSLVAILGLPPLVLAQDTKSIEIKIMNGDTTINGKDIKKLSQQERKDALDEMDKMGNITFKHVGKDGQKDIVIRRNKIQRNGKNDVRIERHMFGNDDNNTSPYRTDFYANDSALAWHPQRIRVRTFKRKQGDSTYAFKFDSSRMFNFEDERNLRYNDNRPLNRGRERRFGLNDNVQTMRVGPQFRFNGPGRERFMGAEGPNTQTFNYSSTDNDGISTDVSFMISDAKMETTLDVNDFNLVPEFSTGKTILSFNLGAKTAASVKLTDSEGKAILSDKVATGSFIKKISMPRNGIYYLTITQGKKSAVKKIVKE